MSVRLSLAMITRDDADVIGRALASAAPVCDELVVVDVGSEDDTAQVAAAKGAVVHSVQWSDDFGAARNACMDRCTGDWVLWLDPDEVIPPGSQDVLAQWKAEIGDGIDVMFAPYHDRYGDDGRPRLTFVKERLVRRAAGLRWVGKVYEHVAVPPQKAALYEKFVVERRADKRRELRAIDRRVWIMCDAVTPDERPPQTLFFFANDLMYHERYSEAAAAYEEYLERDPQGGHRYWALVSLGECNLMLGDGPAGRRALLDAIGEDSSRAEAYVSLGRLHFEAEEWNEAVPLLLAATGATRPAFGFARDADYTYMAWDYLSVCYDKLGRVSEAIDASKRALAGNPQAARIRANLHWMVDRL